MHVSGCAFPQLFSSKALRFEAEGWIEGKDEGCYALSLDTTNFFLLSI